MAVVRAPIFTRVPRASHFPVEIFVTRNPRIDFESSAGTEKKRSPIQRLLRRRTSEINRFYFNEESGTANGIFRTYWFYVCCRPADTFSSNRSLLVFEGESDRIANDACAYIVRINTGTASPF